MDIHRTLLRLGIGLGYCLFGLVITGCNIEIIITRKADGTSTSPQEQEEIGRATDTRNRPKGAAQCIVSEAQGFIGIFERQANRGAEVEAIQKEAGVPVGSPWCQAFVLVVYGRCSVRHAMDGRAASACKNKTKEVRPGDVICFDWNGDGRIQHSGIVEKDEGNRIVTIEGNTSDPQKVSAEGVYRKFRSKSLRYELGKW